jgi:hypothetical protein
MDKNNSYFMACSICETFHPHVLDWKLPSEPTQEDLKLWNQCANCGVYASKLMQTMEPGHIICGDSCKSSCYSYGNERRHWMTRKDQSEDGYIKSSLPVPHQLAGLLKKLKEVDDPAGFEPFQFGRDEKAPLFCYSQAYLLYVAPELIQRLIKTEVVTTPFYENTLTREKLILDLRAIHGESKEQEQRLLFRVWMEKMVDMGLIMFMSELILEGKSVQHMKEQFDVLLRDPFISEFVTVEPFAAFRSWTNFPFQKIFS